MNVYTHIGFDDAEEELKRMEEFRRAQAEVEQKKEKPMSQKMLNQNEIFLENEIQSFVSQLIGYKSKYNLYPHSIQCADSYYGIHSCKHWLDGTCDSNFAACFNLFNSSSLTLILIEYVLFIPISSHNIGNYIIRVEHLQYKVPLIQLYFYQPYHPYIPQIFS